MKSNNKTLINLLEKLYFYNKENKNINNLIVNIDSIHLYSFLNISGHINNRRFFITIQKIATNKVISQSHEEFVRSSKSTYNIYDFDDISKKVIKKLYPNEKTGVFFEKYRSSIFNYFKTPLLLNLTRNDPDGAEEYYITFNTIKNKITEGEFILFFDDINSGINKSDNKLLVSLLNEFK